MNGNPFRLSLQKNGLQLRQVLIWNKNNFTLGRQDYQWKHEPCLYGWKDGASHYFIDDRSKKTVIEDAVDVDKMTKDEMKKVLKDIYSGTLKTTVLNFDKPIKDGDHPTMKPIRLIAELVNNSSKENEIVLDTFGGSGTTLMACEQLDRKAYIMELDPIYVDVIIKRWEQFTGKKAIKLN